MHPPIPHNPNPLHVASHADRFARETHGTLNLVFAAISAISLGVMTTKLILDMVRRRTRTQNPVSRPGALAPFFSAQPASAAFRPPVQLLPLLGGFLRVRRVGRTKPSSTCGSSHRTV